MTANLNPTLWNAILSMDSYNRGYEAGIALDSPDQTIGKQLGKYNIIAHSSDLLDEGGNTGIDQPIGFYALAYEYNGETIISYRGTDYPQNDLHGQAM